MEIELRVNESACVGGTLSASVQVTADDDDTPACDGEATVMVYDGTPPYTYAFSNGITSQTATDLCAGVYSVEVTDALGAQTVSQFAVASSANVYSNLPSNVPAGADTVYGTFYSCDLDYNLPIDSFYIAHAEVIANDTIFIDWIVWQAEAPFTVRTDYFYSGPGPTVYSVVMYCINGRAEDGVFQLFELYTAPLGITETDRLDLSVRPNPSNGVFEVLLNSPEQITIRILDITGKMVRAERLAGANLYTIDLTPVKTGVYIVAPYKSHNSLIFNG